MHSYDLERQCLATLINHPDSFIEISHLITEDDFYNGSSQVNRTIFSILKNSIESGKKIDYVILSERMNALGLSFEDNINISDYIQSLSLRKTNPDNLIDLVKELKNFSVRRQVSKTADQIKSKMKSAPPETSFIELVEMADQEYNDSLSIYDNGENIPQDLCSRMEEFIEERGNNPMDNYGFLGPHSRLHEMYGSLLRPGNLSVICARSGVGKTQFCIDYCLKTSEINGYMPILHLDNGEMSQEELMARICSSMSDVPVYLIETGKWRKAGQDVVNKVRSVWKEIKKHKLHYFNVGGMSIDQIINLVIRFYYAKVGRGNHMILNYDYIKTASEKFNNKSEWQIVGEMVEKFKHLVQTSVVYDKKPMIAMMTSVQGNRIGITNNRSSDNIVEDESTVSLSDRIQQVSSHLFLLRNRTHDELLESPHFGTHKLVCLKNRHLGENAVRALQPVRMEDGTLQKNAILLDFKNFNITEVGDVQDLVDDTSAIAGVSLSNETHNLPNI
jgi:replicative DNA helicase